MSRPLITFLVASYNQEKYIREAVEAAFAQTYSPLEILISDDGSKDRTFDIANEMAAVYRGPHKVRLNRNSKTLGIGGHVNRVMELSRGELIVAAAGDDISLPERTEVYFQAWDQTGRKATSVFSSHSTVDSDGKFLEVGGLRGKLEDPRAFWTLEGGLYEYLSLKTPVVNGCTHAWSPKLFDFFGPISSDLEDLVLSFRTLAIGQLLYVNQPMIKYRRHEQNVSFLAERDDTLSFEHREKRLRWVDEKHVTAYDNMIADIETLFAKRCISASDRDRLCGEARRIRSNYAVERSMMDGSFGRRLITLASVVKEGNVRSAVRSLPRALPRPVYRSLYMLRDRWRHALSVRKEA